MSWKAAVLAVVCALCTAPPENVCRHATSGAARPVSLERVRAAQEGVARHLAAAVDATARVRPDAAFASGLPSCGARRVRRAARELPAALVGRTIAVAPEGRFPAADLRVASAARSLWALEADGLADAALAERLDVRCAPSLVRILSEVELEILESP